MKTMKKEARLADMLFTKVGPGFVDNAIHNLKKDPVMDSIKSKSKTNVGNMAKNIAKPKIKADPGWLNQLHDDLKANA